MRKINFNKNWHFTFQNSLDEFNTFGFDKYSDASGAPARFYDYSNWETVDLPHDWTLSLQKTYEANTFSGAYPNTPYHRFMKEKHSNIETVYNIGWYRKQFDFLPEWTGKRIFIEFEGVFRDACVWVNGVYLDRHTSGYTSFALELTDHLVFGEENSVAVRADSEQPEGWWYEGAGIYRNVNLLVGEPVYFKYNQTVIKSEPCGRVDASAVLVNDTAEPVERTVDWSVIDACGKTVAQLSSSLTLEPYSEGQARAELFLESPMLWSTDTPYLYTLRIQAGEESHSERFGVRSVAFDAERGFLLNGVPLKIRGACVHQDFGGVGVALTDNLQRYKISRLKEMGVNAYRCAHHAPSPALLDACDELGMLVMDETRTFGTSPEAIRQLTDLIERDRNHPCVFIWSLGNEEFSVQNIEWSHRLMQKMTRIAKSLDPTRPVTYGGNNGANFVGANGAAEIRGINYIRNGKRGDWIDIYHAEHPDQPIIGTEESSYVLSRAGAVNSLGSGLLDSTGNVTMPWGSTPKGWVKYMELRDYFAGSFMWTGFDYRGEPNPFIYTMFSSSFGTIDLCGMEKPPFYYYKAWWTDEPVLRLSPHWNHSEGDTVTVAVFTNCEEITLSLGGRTLETRRVERFDAPLFEVPFEAGVLSVEGRRGGAVLRDELVTAGEVAELRCTQVLGARNDGEIAIYEITAYDACGRLCPTASDEALVDVENGYIVGVGNGDPSSADYERKPPEEKVRLIRAFDDGGCMYSVPPKRANTRKSRVDYIKVENKCDNFEDDFRLVAGYRESDQNEITKELVATVCDVEGYEYVELERLGELVEVYLNGELIGDNAGRYGRHSNSTVRPYRFYANFRKGANELRLVCRCKSADVPPVSGYVRIGRRTHSAWQVRLHYGKARVFVKSKTPELLRLAVKLK